MFLITRMKVEYNSPLDVLLGTISILCAAASWAMGRAWGGCCWGDGWGWHWLCLYQNSQRNLYCWLEVSFCVSRFVSTTLEWDVYSDLFVIFLFVEPQSFISAVSLKPVSNSLIMEFMKYPLHGLLLLSLCVSVQIPVTLCRKSSVVFSTMPELPNSLKKLTSLALTCGHRHCEVILTHPHVRNPHKYIDLTVLTLVELLL